MAKNVAIVLSGCGFKDGAEITESVSALIALSEKQAKVKAFAPNRNIESVGHHSGQPSGSRNILEEAARITRGSISPLESLAPEQFDALVLPGGFGAAVHLSSWAQHGSQCEVDKTLVRIIKKFHAESKPIAAFCIAPVIVAKVLGEHEVTVTVGDDSETIAEILKTGALHEECAVDDFITDRHNKVVTTPAYMYGNAAPHLIFKGIRSAVAELIEMA